MRALIYLCLSLAALTEGLEGKKDAAAKRILSRYIPFSTIGLTVDKRVDAVGLSVLSKDFDPEKDLRTENVQTTESEYKLIDSNEDANLALDISEKLSLKLNMGLQTASMSGAGSYFTSVGDRSKFVELLFVTHVKTKSVSIKNIGKSIDGARCKKIPNRLKGTHVITGLEYGAHCVISVRIATSSDENKNDIKGQIKGAIGSPALNVSVGGNLTKMKEELKKMQNVSVRTFCNARLHAFPTTGDEAVELAKSFPALVHQQIPDGIPVRMELTTLSDIPVCEFTPKWNTGSLLSGYLEDTVTMVQDLKSAFSELWSCMDVLAMGQDKRSLAIKTEARQLLDRMKKVDYDMKTYVEKIDQHGGDLQFDEVTKIYTEGHGDKDVDAYAFQYWSAKVKRMCVKVNELEIETENSEIHRHDPCAHKPNVVAMEKEGQQWAHGGNHPEKAVDGVKNSCFMGNGSDTEPVVWSTRMLSFTRNITMIDITFEECKLEQLDDIDVYITSDPQNIGAKVRPKNMFHVGTAKISVLNSKIGLPHKARGLRLTVKGMTGYVSILRLETTGVMCLCEVAAAGMHCPNA